MRWPIISLVALALALVATVFAVWPAVGHAPWEASPAATTDPIRVERCKAALAVRDGLQVLPQTDSRVRLHVLIHRTPITEFAAQATLAAQDALIGSIP